jgi:hypothetical protein
MKRCTITGEEQPLGICLGEIGKITKWCENCYYYREVEG